MSDRRRPIVFPSVLAVVTPSGVDPNDCDRLLSGFCFMYLKWNVVRRTKNKIERKKNFWLQQQCLPAPGYDNLALHSYT